MTSPYPQQPPPWGNDPYQSYGQTPQNGIGTTALVLGIVGLPLMFLCFLGTIASILAIVFGKIGMDKARDGLATNRGMAQAGMVLGIVGVALAVIGAAVYFLIIVAAGSGSRMY